MTDECTTSREEFSVLIVDDEQAAVDGISRRLRGQPYTVRTAVSGQHALAMMRESPAHILVTDLKMPGMDGIELTRSVLRSFPDTRVILLTGHGDMAVAVEAMRAGAVDFLQKPVDFERLSHALSQAGEKYQELCKLKGAKRPPAELFVNHASSGKIVGGYRLSKPLGQGNYGVVYLCERLSDRCVFAMKVLRNVLPGGGDPTVRFVNEAIAISHLDHPSIIRFVEYGEATVDDQLSPFYVMEYFEGESLKKKIGDGGIPLLSDKIHIIKQAASALHAVHSLGIIHRDIKPDNILVNEFLKVKLTDFGVCHLPNSELTMTSELLGTPSYLAPEYIRTGQGDARIDIYSLGIVAYELISGVRPYRVNSVVELVAKLGSEDPIPLGMSASGIPESVEKVVMQMISKSPDRRIWTPAEVITRLNEAERDL